MRARTGADRQNTILDLMDVRRFDSFPNSPWSGQRRMQWPSPATILKIAQKAVGQARLLRTNPEEFLRNIRQFTNPAAFQDRLLDIATIPTIRVSVTVGAPPTLNIFLPVISREMMTGGPNTALTIGQHLASAGIAVRFVSCDRPRATASPARICATDQHAQPTRHCGDRVAHRRRRSDLRE
jgi:hypothetical protein